MSSAASVSSRAEDAADAILYDLSGRAGFDAWWDDIAPDVKDDIRDAMVELTANAFRDAHFGRIVHGDEDA